MTAMRVAMVMASTWSWVTYTNVVSTPPVQVDQLDPGLGPQLGVEVGQRLVHEERLGPADDRSGQGHPLALAAREGGRLALDVGLEVEDARRLGHPLASLGLGQLAGGSISAVDLVLADDAAATRCSWPPSCADTARSSGTPSRCRASPARRR